MRFLRRDKIPYVTLTLVFVNVACFLVEQILTERRTSYLFGMYANALSVGPGALYRMVTSGFFHYGIAHLLSNMLALVMMGMELEWVIGWWRFLVIYAAGLIGGSLMIQFLGGSGLHMGASSAIWGMMAALLIVVLRLHANPTGIMRVLVVNLAITFYFREVSWQGHIGGGIAGLIVSLLVLSIRPPRRLRRRPVLHLTEDEANRMIH